MSSERQQISQTRLAAELWEKVRKLDEFYWSDLARLGCAEKTAKNYIRKWETAGWIRLVRKDNRNRRHFVASDRPICPIGPPPVSAEATPEGNMWRAMRHLREFSPTDIAAHANAGGIDVTVDKARAYCRQLLASEHLKVRQTAIPGRREALYRVVEDTGPRPPRQVRLVGILDPNTGKFIPAKGGAT